ncbi:hypothetical protein D9M72_481380 [compost metagenome]
MVRWLVMWARGVFAVQRYLVIMMFGMPWLERNRDAELPAGPEPTISTSVMTMPVPSGRAVAVIPSLKIGMTTSVGCGWTLWPALALRW